ncbi:arylsulfatase [Marinilongibacter aquaticus]|uniref:arylsulfatase n=1 Tax=Marinilongibacter aquaticus TaxID=2975157 RepID=UPI0021BD9C94|nr:arylsulfatase [Marinilongibacter aquaticus]UBM59403.1 arylsulfatase [Marinilongibacter aquaticus]
MNKYILAFCGLFIFPSLSAQEKAHPNVILIVTDDQGYGDFGFTGNPHAQTPVLDKFANENTLFTNYHVSPVCAPTRSSLMTGRYSIRTGVRDTYNGGATMSTEEVTIAEMLKAENYRTGIFGKWHLGDNYPSRPMDQGFDESLIHLSGGMGQVGDFTTFFQGNRSYFDPVLWHNGQKEAYKGYCSDIFAEQAMRFIGESDDKPFFCYLAFNAPHTPLQVPKEYYDRFKDIDPSQGFDSSIPMPKMSEKDKEDARKVYAMVANIDDNLGRLFNLLEEKGLAENTIILFMTDNGPQQYRYTKGFREKKGNVYNGGICTPLIVHHPDYRKAQQIGTLSAHIDILPTIMDFCGIKKSPQAKLDGKSLVPCFSGKGEELNDRSLFFYWTRRYPELYQNIALIKGDFKLVGNTSYDAEIGQFSLYNVREDPFEKQNILENNTALAQTMKKELDATYTELIQEEHFKNQPLIEIGNEKERVSFLNRNDADGERGIWAQEEIYGKWNVFVNEGNYNVKFKFVKPVSGKGKLLLEANKVVFTKEIPEGEFDVIEMQNVHLSEGIGEIVPTYQLKGKNIFPFWLEIERLD